MARHANGKNTYAVAGWVIVLAIIAAIALIGALIWALTGSGDDGSDSAAETVAETTTDSAAERNESTTSAPASSEKKTSAAKESTSETVSSRPASTGALDTLMLVDTSDQMAAAFETVSAAIADVARGLEKADHAVALWNYSSPLNPGVEVGYRNNLGFGSGQEVADSVTQFGTGGVPQTRSAVAAALQTATDRAAEVDDSTRVVLVTTGTEDNMSDEDFKQALGDAKGDNVQLSVVRIGENATDEVLEAAADAVTTVANPDQKDAVEEAVREAAGI